MGRLGAVGAHHPLQGLTRRRAGAHGLRAGVHGLSLGHLI